MSSDEENNKASTNQPQEVITRVSESAEFDPDKASVQDEVSFHYDDSQKIGITGAVFLSVMSRSFPSQ